MLPDFTVGVSVGGRAYTLVARDVPTCVFFHRYPDLEPLPESWERADLTPDVRSELAVWIDELLIHVVVQPPLTRELLARLGAGRDDAARAYLAGVGWFSGESETADTIATSRTGGDRSAAHDEPLRAYTAAPPPKVGGALVKLASSVGALPSTIWRLPISEWIFSARLLRIVLPHVPPGPYTNDPALLKA